MSDFISIEGSPVWQTGTEVYPAFGKLYSDFCTTFDKFGGPLMHEKLKIFGKDFKVACVDPNKKSNTNDGDEEEEEKICISSPISQNNPDAFPIPYLCLVPFTVTPEVCDMPLVAGGGDREKEEGVMSIGAVNALTDMLTSFHIIMVALPEKPGHVSVTIQSNNIQPLRCGKRYLALSKIDKVGRRLVYTSVEFLEENIFVGETGANNNASAMTVPPEVLQKNREMRTVRQLLNMVQYATVLANVKHVKSFLSSAANQQAVEQREKPKAVVEG